MNFSQKEKLLSPFQSQIGKIVLSPPAIEASYTICDVCIEKLRNALEFKKQVEDCEMKFENYCKNEILLQSKMEIESSSGYEVTIKPEIQIEIEDCCDKSPIHKYPELDNYKVSDTEENFNYEEGIENTDNKQYYSESSDIPTSSLPSLNYKEQTEIKEVNTEYKLDYLEVDTSKSNPLNAAKMVKQVTNELSRRQKITKIKRGNGVIKQKLKGSASESKESNKNKHILKNTKNLKGSPYNCPSCKFTYKTLLLLRRHIQRQHSLKNPTKKYSCRSCKGTYRTAKTLTLHMAKEHAVMTCTICDRDFNSKQLWYKHHQNKHKMYLVHKESVGKFVCNECGATVKRRSTLKAHIMYKHTKTQPKKVYTCDVCKKNYADRTTIRRHIEWFHSGVAPIKKYMCDICGLTIKDRTNLRIHIDTVHKKLRPYKCDQCPKSFAANKELKVHLRWHSGELPYKCRDCDQKFIRFRSLQYHLKRHHNPYSASNVTIQKTESDQKFDFSFRYECKICRKGFDKRSEITAHNWTHTGSKPYKCEFCEKDFISIYCYKRHMLLHQTGGPKRVPCDICQKTFSSKAPMQRHVRTIHAPERVSPAKKQGLKVKCEVCKILVWDMEKHNLKKHSGNCHQCEFCQRSYSGKGVLNRHIKERHSGINNDCKLCGKKYIKSWSLKKHMVKKHNSM